MEFSFNINELVPDIITVVDHKLSPFRCLGKSDRYEFATKQSQLKMIIDKIGESSTRAQGLRTPITSAIKLQHSDHRLYIMKDSSANNGLGAVVGILKVGHKKLFLLDVQSVQNEVHPLCVLDFYIHESRQRTGCGRRMFEHVLKAENKMANQVAIDRPSHKFVAFLKKYYGLKNAIPQANNFVIHDQFFSDPQAIGLVPCRGQRFVDESRSRRPPHHPYYSTSKAGGLHLGPSSVPSSYRPNSGQSISYLSSSSAGTNRKPDYSSTFMMNDSLRDLNLPPLVPRPPSRNLVPGSRESSLGGMSMVSRRKRGSFDQVQPEMDNASRGMAARASSFSRHSARTGSADLVRSSKGTEAADKSPTDNSFIRSNSGGRIRSLHLTSVENPFMRREEMKVFPLESSDLQTSQQDNGTNITAQQIKTVSNSFSSSENYSINSLFNERFGVRPPFLGSSWNIFGVPSYINKDSNSPHYMYTKRTQQRHHPF